MVQLFYYENRGKNFKKLMSYEGIPFRVNLFPNEDVGSALTSYWIVKIPWWSKTTAKILEVCGAHYRYASGKVVDMGDGNIMIKGRFQDGTKNSDMSKLLQYVADANLARGARISHYPIHRSGAKSPIQSQTETDGEEVRLHLSTNVSNEDFHRGYSMSGSLERGHKKSESFSLTHFALVKRKGY